jgi:hypothetical protein
VNDWPRQACRLPGLPIVPQRYRVFFAWVTILTESGRAAATEKPMPWSRIVRSWPAGADHAQAAKWRFRPGAVTKSAPKLSFQVQKADGHTSEVPEATGRGTMLTVEHPGFLLRELKRVSELTGLLSVTRQSESVVLRKSNIKGTQNTLSTMHAPN